MKPYVSDALWERVQGDRGYENLGLLTVPQRVVAFNRRGHGVHFPL